MSNNYSIITSYGRGNSNIKGEFLYLDEDPNLCKITYEEPIEVDLFEGPPPTPSVFLDPSSTPYLPTPLPLVTPTPFICGGGCPVPSSEDSTTVEYYGYASDPSWCDCIAEGYICNSAEVTTTAGNKVGYYCDDSPNIGCIQYLNVNHGCIYENISCNPPYNLIASKIFRNPHDYSVPVAVTGTVENDVLLIKNNTQLWLRSGSTVYPSCTSGSVNYTFTAGAKEMFTIQAWGTFGPCASVDITVKFDPANCACNPPAAAPVGNDVLVLSVAPMPDTPPAPQFYRRKACYRCCEITVDSGGNVISSNYGSTTNNLNLPQILVTNNLIPTVAGTYLFVFVFYGWRKNTVKPTTWISKDDKYTIWTDSITTTLLPP